MAHSSAKSLPEFPGVPQSKTLFLTAPGVLGKLVSRRGEKLSARQRRFKGPHAALDWCIAEQISFVYTPVAPDPAFN